MARKKTTRKNLRSTPAFDEPWSRNEAILQNILGANNVLVDPQSRNEAILQAILNSTAYTEDPQSRIEELLLCILNGTATDMVAQSRNEEILIAKINGGSYTEEPQSRIEALLIEWLNAAPAYIEKTVTGNPISISDAIAAAALALSVALEPIQDLHGYSNPWPAGGGKNLLDPSTMIIYGDGKGRRWYENEGYLLKANTAYTLSVSGTEQLIRVYFRAKLDGTDLVSANGSVTYTPTEDTLVYLQAYRGSVIEDGNHFQLELGSTATSYAPYSNICPISGRTEVTVERTDGDGNNPQSLTVQLGETVYGGTVDIISGELTVTKKSLVFDSSAWSFSSDFFYKANTVAVGENVSGYYTTENGIKIYINSNNGQARIYLADNDFLTSESDVGSMLNGYKLIYTLATPITVQLTPEELELLEDNNIIQTDAGTITLTYKAKAE